MWGEAVKAASYLLNHTSTRTIPDKTPFEVWYGRRPDLSHLRELGCKVWVHIPGENPKIYNRSVECTLVGYSVGSQAYRCLERATGRIHVTRNTFFAESQDLRKHPLRPELSARSVDVDDGDPACIQPADDMSPTDGAQERPEAIPHRSPRLAHLRQTALGETMAQSAIDTPEGCIHFVFGETEWANLSNEEDPVSYKDAFSRPDAPQWQAAYEDEMNSLRKHKVWDLIPCNQVPDGRKIIPSKLVFHYKRDSAGNVTCHKVRVVAKGYAQKPGVDYTDTYAPVVRMESTRAILHIGASLDWEIHQMDVKTAFLHSELEEEVYMEQPEGMKEPGKENWVCYMRKTLYGLMQVAQAWNLRLHCAMLDNGYTQISSDHCIYVRKGAAGSSIIAIHVDDMVAAASTKDEMAMLKQDLGRLFDLVDLGEVTWLLGVAVTRDRDARTISLCQAAYIESIAARLKLEDAYPVTTPLDPYALLSKAMCPTSDEEIMRMKKIPYLTAIGSIMYAAIATRPDVAFAVQHLSQFNSNPGLAHWTAAQRVMRYLYATRHRTLVLGSRDVSLTGWVDSDWGACTDMRCSTSGYAFSLGTGIISWSSKKQPTVATSSTEAEYIASCHGAKEAVWLRSLLKFLGFAQDGTTTIHCDNVGSNILTRNPSFHA